MGLPADICIWDTANGTVIHRLSLQKVPKEKGAGCCNSVAPRATDQGRIQAIDWSCDERFLITLGGPDDNTLARSLYVHKCSHMSSRAYSGGVGCSDWPPTARQPMRTNHRAGSTMRPSQATSRGHCRVQHRPGIW